LIALHQLIGPVLFRAGLSRAGEIGQMSDAEEEEDEQPIGEPLTPARF
jgi:hypothetical protein